MTHAPAHTPPAGTEPAASKIRRNRAKCRECGDIIESKYRHDFRSCKCGAIFVDGGTDYLRAGGDPADFEAMYE